MKSEPEDVSIALVAIKALIKTISNSKATTMMGLQEELEAAIQRLQRSSSSFALHSGCELFLRFVTRTSDEIEDFERCKQRVLSRGERFLQMAGQCRSKINVLADRFIRDGVVVLTHGYSRVVRLLEYHIPVCFVTVLTVLQVHSLLVHAASKNKRFRVIVSESRPDNAGYKTIKRLTEAGITCNLITDAGVAYAMEEVDIVIIGAEAVVENGCEQSLHSKLTVVSAVS
jgi:translation initiation factor eIF-2B subunit alpha